MSKARCVLISDIHFSVPTLELASNALGQAIEHAKRLHIPLVIAGDLLDSKAIIRGECANRLIELLSAPREIRVLILVGNHDLLNEKGLAHSLNFLRPYCEVIDTPVFDDQVCAWLFPYFSDAQELLKWIKITPNHYPIIMHQGVMGAEMGAYVIDKTSLPKAVFANHRVISGHYHKAQNIECGKPGKEYIGIFSYIGSPYTITYAEANDGPKGFRVLHEDGSLESVSTNLRKHVIINSEFDKYGVGEDCLKYTSLKVFPDDLLWLKITGPQSELEKINKKELGMRLFGHSNFKLDKIPTETIQVKDTNVNLMDYQLLDNIINNKSESDQYKVQLKKLWRELLQ